MAAIELTDVESVRQFMQKSISDKLQDEDIAVLIAQLSEELPRYLNREFTASTATRTFEYLPNTGLYDLVDLKPYEYRTVKKVVVDTDLKAVTLTAIQYRPYPYPARDGTFFGLRLAELPTPAAVTGLASSPSLPYQTRRVDVEADWGMGSVPQGLQHWSNVAVEAWVHLRRGAITSGEGEGPMPTIDDLPVTVKRGLRRWERPTPSA